jgi:hypothetical protein
MGKFTPLFTFLLILVFHYQNSFGQGVAINTTGSSPSVMLHVTSQDGSNNTLEILRIDRTNNAAVGGANIAGAINFRNENSASALTLAAGITAKFDVATSGSEEGTLILLYGKNNTLSEGMRLDGTAGYVGINALSPQARLTVVEENNVNNTTLEVLRLQRINIAAAGADGIGVSQSFFLESATEGTYVKGASIDVILEDATSGSENGNMKFNVAIDGAVAEYMRVDGTLGHVGIGTTSPSSRLHVLNDDGSNNVLQLLTIERNNTAGAGGNSLGAQIAFLLEDAGNQQEHADIDARIVNATNGSEDVALEFYVTTDGAVNKKIMGIIGDQGGAVSFFGGVEYPIRSVSGNGVSVTLDRSDYYVTANCTGASDITVNLPAAAGTSITGHVYIIKRTNATAGNDVIIDPNGAETIDGSATFTITSQWNRVAIISNGTNWEIID